MVSSKATQFPGFSVTNWSYLWSVWCKVELVFADTVPQQRPPRPAWIQASCSYSCLRVRCFNASRAMIQTTRYYLCQVTRWPAVKCRLLLKLFTTLVFGLPFLFNWPFFLMFLQITHLYIIIIIIIIIYLRTQTSTSNKIKRNVKISVQQVSKAKRHW